MSTFFISLNGGLQTIFYLGTALLLVKPLGSYMAKVYTGQALLLENLLGPLEDFIYRMAKIDPIKEMNWQEYAYAVLLSSLGGFLLLFAILSLQGYLPLNPQHLPHVSPDLAFNIAASFVSNTNWQSYAGESTLSYLSQMLGLTVQNFLSASMGMAVAVALIRSFVRKNTSLLGNFWVDWVRGILYILLPFSFIFAIILGSQGVIQNFNPNTITARIEAPQESLTIPGGPVASQVAIKQLGSNGGGFFNSNAAHPFENPSPLSNFLEMLAIILIPAALCYTFGVMVNDRKQGWALLAAMAIIFMPLTLFSIAQEQAPNPHFQNLNIEQSRSYLQSGGNMEGKELRFGIVNSALWTSLTTATSNGSVNSMIDSYSPLGGMVPAAFIMLGEIIFGGVGSGIYGILLNVLITVFIAGLMVGRTPEFLGKKLSSFEIKMASIAILIPVMTLLFGTAICVFSKAGLSGTLNPGHQGFSEILYACTSASGNNGSAFAGLNSNTPFYNTLLGIIMLIARYWIIIPVLAIAGSFAEKNAAPANSGTMPTHTFIFINLLIWVIILVGLLTFVPVLTLGPISEYFQLVK